MCVYVCIYFTSTHLRFKLRRNPPHCCRSNNTTHLLLRHDWCPSRTCYISTNAFFLSISASVSPPKLRRTLQLSVCSSTLPYIHVFPHYHPSFGCLAAILPGISRTAFSSSFPVAVEPPDRVQTVRTKKNRRHDNRPSVDLLSNGQVMDAVAFCKLYSWMRLDYFISLSCSCNVSLYDEIFFILVLWQLAKWQSAKQQLAKRTGA